jgi:hypothetical protein
MVKRKHGKEKKKEGRQEGIDRKERNGRKERKE